MRKDKLLKRHLDKLEEYGLNINELHNCSVYHFDSGESIYKESYPISWLGIVTLGKAKVCSSSSNGKNLVLCYFVSAGTIGGIELMANKDVATASLIALTEFECIAIPFEENTELLKNKNKFLNRLCYEISNNLVISSNNFVSSALHTGEQRLCSYILESSQNGIFNDVLSDVACSVGLSYRHLFRLINQLCEEGILSKMKNGYKIKHNDLLIEKAADARYTLVSI